MVLVLVLALWFAASICISLVLGQLMRRRSGGWLADDSGLALADSEISRPSPARQRAPSLTAARG